MKICTSTIVDTIFFQVSHKSEEVWQKEKRQLTQLLSQKQLTTPKQLKLKKISDQPLTNAEEALTQLEENAHQLREQLKDTRATSTVSVYTILLEHRTVNVVMF